MASSKGPQKRVVLVVEDEPLVRMSTVAALEDEGFDVVEAGNADEAIAILEARMDIRIVFTDVGMPGSMDGIKLANAIRDRWPLIELIITSAMPAPSAVDIPLRGIFLPKPYRADRLVSAIRSFG